MARTTSPNVAAIPAWVTTPPWTSLTTIAPVPAKTRANVPTSSATTFRTIRPSPVRNLRLNGVDLDARRELVHVVPRQQLGEPAVDRRPGRRRHRATGRRPGRGRGGRRRRAAAR